MRLAVAVAVAVAAALALPAMPAVAQQAGKAGEDKVVETLLDCGPKTYDEAMACLDKALVPANKAELASGDRQGVGHGLDFVIRNLWMAPGPLSAALDSLGVTETEAKAKLILDGYSARLRGEPFDPALKAAAYRAGSHGQHSGDSQ
jgi:hypothetical protein